MEYHRYLTLPVIFIRDELAFETSADVTKFIADHNAPFYQNPNAEDDSKNLNCKQAQLPLSQAYDERYRKAKLKGAI